MPKSETTKLAEGDEDTLRQPGTAELVGHVWSVSWERLSAPVCRGRVAHGAGVGAVARAVVVGRAWFEGEGGVGGDMRQGMGAVAKWAERGMRAAVGAPTSDGVGECGERRCNNGDSGVGASYRGRAAGAGVQARPRTQSPVE